MRLEARRVQRSHETMEETLRKVTEQLHTTTNNIMEFYIVVIVMVNDCQHK